MGKKIYCWPIIAIDYDGGMSWSDIKANYGCGHEAIQKAIVAGKLKRRPRIKPKSRPRKIKTKEQNSAYCRAHYQKNKDRYRQKARANGLARSMKCRELALHRLKLGCVDCGVTDPLVLEFDHRDRQQKEHEISKLISPRFASVQRLKARAGEMRRPMR